MKILICSDSHNKSILSLNLDEFNYIIHLGDIKDNDIDYFNLYPNLIYVRGNCDYNNYELVKEVVLNDYKIFLTHSHLYNTKYSLDLLISNTINKYDFVLYGHTHKQQVFKLENTIYLNPGAFKDGCYVVIENNGIYLINGNKKEVFNF